MNVKSNHVKRRRPNQTDKESTDKNPKRTNAKTFYLLEKRVCQSFFLKTLSISNGPLLKAFEHKNKFTNFFDGDDKRGKHQPANKLSAETIAGIVAHLESFASKNASNKCKKRIICDSDVRSLKHLYRLYQENREPELCPSYTSFKKIFTDNGFAMADHLMSRPQRREEEEVKEQDQEIEYIIEDENVSKVHEIVPVIQQVIPQPKVLFTQVQDNQEAPKLVSYPVYEIQLVNFQLATNPNQSFQ